MEMCSTWNILLVRLCKYINVRDVEKLLALLKLSKDMASALQAGRLFVVRGRTGGYCLCLVFATIAFLT